MCLAVTIVAERGSCLAVTFVAERGSALRAAFTDFNYL